VAPPRSTAAECAAQFTELTEYTCPRTRALSYVDMFLVDGARCGPHGTRVGDRARDGKVLRGPVRSAPHRQEPPDHARPPPREQPIDRRSPRPVSARSCPEGLCRSCAGNAYVWPSTKGRSQRKTAAPLLPLSSDERGL